MRIQSNYRRRKQHLVDGTGPAHDGGFEIAKLLTLLEHLAARPDMHVQPLDVASMQNYLHGLSLGCALGGMDRSGEAHEQVVKARGWKRRATGIVWHMRAKKLDEAAIIQELIAIQTEAFRLAASVMKTAARK